MTWPDTVLNYRKVMEPDKLSRIIYTSSAATKPSSADLAEILAIARRNNARRSVTGMLLYTSGTFFQVLEGGEPTLQELFTKIAADRRHRNVTRIIDEPIAQRDFGEWTMGFSEVDPSDLERIEGLNDFFQKGESLSHLAPGRAKKLLAAFAHGRWRARLEGTPSERHLAGRS